jgi:uncharacterized protein YutE (UPF0331/DUF86 family)
MMTKPGPIVVEYLVLADPKKGVGTTLESLRHLLQAHEEIVLDGEALRFRGKQFSFTISAGKVVTSGDCFFHMKLGCSAPDSLVEFAAALQAIRSIVGQFSPVPAQTLWDGVGYHYATMAYPIIHRVENQMRKLITKFMFINVGVGWTKSNVPEEVHESIRASKKTEHNFLFGTDFIQLANFLFKPYAIRSQAELTALMESSVKANTGLLPADLEPFLAKSNWTRYFQQVVDCDASYLEKRWARLYELRCVIAHNSILSRSDYEDIKKLSDEPGDKLESAVAKVAKVEMGETERESVAVEAASIDQCHGKFLTHWKKFDQGLREAMVDSLPIVRTADLWRPDLIRRMMLDLVGAKLVDPKTAEEWRNLNMMRNVIVHDARISYSAVEIAQATEAMARLELVIAEAMKAYGTLQMARAPIPEPEPAG